MKIEKKDLPANDAILRGTIERIFKKADSLTDAPELAAYTAAVKKAVPLGKRTLFISYLLQETLKKVLAQKSELTTLFVSIGRTRSITQRDLAALFIDHLSLEKSALGDIRVFDNYSFVEIAKEYADKAITTLSQVELKGKKLIVNYSRKKPEKRNFGPRRNKRDR